MAIAHASSMKYASLGSCIATCSHGHPGCELDEFHGLNWVRKARVYHITTRTITDDEPSALREKFGNREKEGKYIVLDVELNTTDNVLLVRKARSINSAAAVEWVLAGTHMRLVFIGSYGSLGIKWSTPACEDDVDILEMHPHPEALCVDSRFTFWCTVDLAALLPCTSMGDLTRFDGKGRLAAANDINPTFQPIFTIWPQLCCVYNVELFCPYTWKAEDLHVIIHGIANFHKEYGGRSEIRVSGPTTYFDLSINSMQKMQRYFTRLYDLGIERAAMHSGKYRPDTICPIARIEVAEALRDRRACV